ncbi:MAG: RNase adapter RapZ [Clostridia bacterium]|nr:RNase adapter RapZ [Clostridia bacterium]
MYLLIVSGMSGAGKSLALNSLEELGFFCVDNLPSLMLKEFVSLCKNAQPEIKRAAVTIDSRESLLSRNSSAVISAIEELDTPYDVLFLDARDDVLRKRYNETRRRHPLGEAGEAESGVRRERIFLQAMRNIATYTVDTSDILPRKFSSMISKLLPEMEEAKISLIISSFGYKRGVPIDADIVLDMRFIENPFYIEELRELSGLCKEVHDFVFSHKEAVEFMDVVEGHILKMLPLYEAQEKHILRVCFGCTGGRHRSVAAVEDLARRMRAKGQAVRIYHRDLRFEAEDIEARIANKEI